MTISLRFVRMFPLIDSKKITSERRRAKMMFNAASGIFTDKSIGIAHFKDGSVQTIGMMNILGGVCDDCTIDFENVIRIDVYEIVGDTK